MVLVKCSSYRGLLRRAEGSDAAATAADDDDDDDDDGR